MKLYLKKYRGYFIDLDGTMYKGGESIPSAVAFVKELSKRDIPYLFLTNNAAKTQEEIAKQLRAYGILCHEKHVFTSAMATAQVICEEKRNASVYMIGESGLACALKAQGIIFDANHPDYVVIGLDRKLTYEKLVLGALAIRKGAKFISTNGDLAIPTERGFVPGNGSLTSVLQMSTGVDPLFIGKPEHPIMEQALKVLGTTREETLMVGDNYRTDIMAGLKFGMDTLCVFTGVTSKEDLQKEKVQPTYCVDVLTDWIKHL